MTKEILGGIERILELILFVLALIGMFFISCFIFNLFNIELSNKAMVVVGFGCAILTYILNTILLTVKYHKLEFMVDELEREKDEEANKLYNHLMDNVKNCK